MLAIKTIYGKLERESEVIFQIKNKRTFDKVIKLLKPIFEKDRDSDMFIFLEDDITYKNAYFVLGKWRDGMFKLRIDRSGNNYDHEIYILADHKEGLMANARHSEQIDDIIKILDKYRKDIVIKRLMFNEDFDIVRFEHEK